MTHSIPNHSILVNRAQLKPTGFSERVADTLPKAIQQIVQQLQPEKIVLFGSYAYGMPTGDSDVDLLVVMQTAVSSPTKRYLRVSRLLRPRPFPVDILVKTPDEITRGLKSGDFFIKEILSRGQVLYERDH